MKIVVGSHTKVGIGNGQFFPTLWNGKTFSVAVTARGFMSLGKPFSTQHMKELEILGRISDAVLAGRVIREIARNSLDLKDWEILPPEVFTDTGYQVSAVFLEFSEDSGIYFLYSLVEGVLCPVRVEGNECQLHGKGRVETKLLFCLPFYCLSSCEDTFTIETPVMHIKAICELINGNVVNHRYLANSPSVFFSYITQKRGDHEIVGNKSIIAELRNRRWLSYVK